MKVIGTLVVWFRSTVQRAFRREFVENDWWFSPVCAGLYEESVTRQVAVQKDIWSRQTYYGICCSICNNSYAKLWGTGWAVLDLHYAHGLHQNLCTSFKAALTLMAPWLPNNLDTPLLPLFHKTQLFVQWTFHRFPIVNQKHLEVVEKKQIIKATKYFKDIE